MSLLETSLNQWKNTNSDYKEYIHRNKKILINFVKLDSEALQNFKLIYSA